MYIYIYCGGVTDKIKPPVLCEFWYVVRAQWPKHSLEFTGWQHKILWYSQHCGYFGILRIVDTLVYSLRVGTLVYSE